VVIGVAASSLVAVAAAFAQPRPAASPRPAAPATVADLAARLRATAGSLAASTGMRRGFATLQATHGLPAGGVRYEDFVRLRLLFEATRDAGLWNVQWRITDREPRSDEIWRQWQAVRAPSPPVPTATAECDEISALFAFLARALDVRGVGLFWPTWNHTVAVWQIPLPARPPVRVVVPTTQIFLDEDDLFGTKRFDPWEQRAIHDYTRRDVPASLRLPPELLAFFVARAERYGGATDETLQRLRYLREAVFLRRSTPQQAAILASRDGQRVAARRGAAEDVAAFAEFAREMRAAARR
jgi:hypothetical protein